MPKETPAQKETVERVMHEFKHGELKGRDGRKVKNARQAVAIGLSEAGASNRETPEENRHNLSRSKAKERRDDTYQQEAEGQGALKKSRAKLYEEARRRDIPGRSNMDRDQIAKALGEG